MKFLVCLLEERSAEEMLNSVLSRILPKEEICFHCIAFEGKQDLDKQIERKLRGWLQPDTFFLVIRDQDAGDCHAIKQSLAEKVESGGKRAVTCIRIACRELESFYLGDLVAVEAGLSIRGLARLQEKAKYRNPDGLGYPSKELIKLTKKEYRKVSGSRAIAPHMRLDGSNRSHSFNILLDGVKGLVGV